MSDKKAREILGVSENASLEDIRKAYHNQVKKYHSDVNQTPEGETKIREVNFAHEYLISQNELKKNKEDNEKAFDELTAFVKKEQARLKSLNIVTFPILNNKLLDPKNRGLIDASIFKEEQERLKHDIADIIYNAETFDKYLEKIAESRKKTEEWNATNIKFLFFDENELKSKYRGMIRAEDLNKSILELDAKMKEIKNNIDEYDNFIAYIVDLGDKIYFDENEQFLKTKLKSRGIMPASDIRALRNQIEKNIKKRERQINDFKKFYKAKEKELKELYNANLGNWEEYIREDNILKYSLDTFNNVKKDIMDYESKLQKKKAAYDEFMEYYESLSDEDKNLLEDKFGDYISWDNRATFDKKTYDDIKRQFEKLKQEEQEKKEYQIVYNDFISFFNRAEKELQDKYSKDLSKWQKYTINDKHSVEDLVKAKEEIRAFVKELEEQAQKEKEEREAKEKAYKDFLSFYEREEKELQEKYGQDLSSWEKFTTNSEEYTIEDLEQAQAEISAYEKDISEKDKAHSEFVNYYESLSLEDKILFRGMNIDNYLSTENRLSYKKAIYDEIKNNFLKAKKEQEEKKREEQKARKALEDFTTFFKKKNEELKKLYGKDLSKWEKYISGKKYSVEELAKVKEEILDFEIELKKERDAYINLQLNNRSEKTFDKVVEEELRKRALKLQQEEQEKQAYKEAFTKFIAFFSAKEKEVKKLYNSDLSKWKKYIIGSEKYQIEDLDKAKDEINEYLTDLEEKKKAHNQFIKYYDSLSVKDRILYQSIVDIDKYISEENSVLYNSDTYDEIKSIFAKYKKKKEEKEREERKKRVKKNFIDFFNKKEELFKTLYNVDLYKWRKYSLEENEFSEEEYTKIKKEINDYEDKKEHERLNKLYNLQSLLKSRNIDIVKFLNAKGKEINDVSIDDINTYSEYFFNISFIIGKIKSLKDGDKQLNKYLEEQGLKTWEVEANKLFEFYTNLCIEETKEEVKRDNKEDETIFITFRDYYFEMKRKFKELYGIKLSIWDDYINNKDNHSKEEFKDAYNDLKEEENKHEETRMSLLSQLQSILKKVEIDIVEYLNVRDKNYLSVSCKDLEEYMNMALLLLKISTDDKGREFLTSYLEDNNININEINYNMLLSIYRDMKKEENLHQDNSFKH